MPVLTRCFPNSRWHPRVSLTHQKRRPPFGADQVRSFGTYYFFFAEGIVSIIFVWFFLPETKGRALEELDAIFALPWYKIGRVGRLYADDEGLGLVRVPEGKYGDGTVSPGIGEKGEKAQFEVV